MTLEFICNILEREGEDPILLRGCVLILREKEQKDLIYSLQDDFMEICDAGKHNDMIYQGYINSEEEIEKIILNSLK